MTNKKPSKYLLEPEVLPTLIEEADKEVIPYVHTIRSMTETNRDYFSIQIEEL